MQIFIVGSGKLASELFNELEPEPPATITAWQERGAELTPAIVIHAGSGKALPEVFDFCTQTGSTLIELATGTTLPDSPGFPLLLCPNVNILMLKFMNMLSRSGASYRDYRISVTESHQSEKSSTPGTAVNMAQSLGIDPKQITSVRDKKEQQEKLQIPAEQLDRHAFHRITIEDDACSILMETRVYGASPYAGGVAKIIRAVRTQSLSNRLYEIDEFIEKGWV